MLPMEGRAKAEAVCYNKQAYGVMLSGFTKFFDTFDVAHVVPEAVVPQAGLAARAADALGAAAAYLNAFCRSP